MTLSVKNTREGGSLVESIERRTKDIPGNWAERARTIAAKDIAPALERQLAELRAERRRDRRPRHLGPSARRGVLPVGPEGVDDDRHVARRSPRDGPSELERLQARMDAILKEIGYAQGSVGERMKALAKDPKYKFSAGDKGRAEIMAFIQNRLTGSARRCRARSTRSSTRTWK